MSNTPPDTQYADEALYDVGKWQTYFQVNTNNPEEADCGIFYHKRPGQAYAVARCPRYVRRADWLKISNRMIDCTKACDGIENPEQAIAAAKVELRHLVGLIEPALEAGVNIPGLATMNGAKRVLSLLNDNT